MPFNSRRNIVGKGPQRDREARNTETEDALSGYPDPEAEPEQTSSAARPDTRLAPEVQPGRGHLRSDRRNHRRPDHHSSRNRLRSGCQLACPSMSPRLPYSTSTSKEKMLNIKLR